MSLRTLGLKAPFAKIFNKPNFDIKPYQTILDFKNAEESIANILTRSDQEMGGYSTVHFDMDPVTHTAKFHGILNLDLPKDKPEVTRSGYAMFRTKDQGELWLSGDSYWDWSHYSALVLRVNGDRRKYLVNIQANTPLITDLFQHRLFLNTPGEWETVVIPLNDFVMTNWGVIQDGSTLNKNEVKTIGIGLLDKQYGPFNLNIDWIKVMTGEEVERFTQQSRNHQKLSQEFESDIDAAKESESPDTKYSALRNAKYEEPKTTIF